MILRFATPRRVSPAYWSGASGATKLRRAATIGAPWFAIAAALVAAPARAQQAGGAVQLDTVDISNKNKNAQTATGPIDGYVATKSAAGTKTATPLNETPQAIQVVGAEQIRDQAATTMDEATRYSPGVRSQTFGDDPRNDWFLIRGFNEQTTGYYLDGLQLFSTAFATYKLDPYGLERIDIVRGPSAVTYGGGDPGGVIDAVSKMPTFTNFGTVGVGVNSWGNVYSDFDIGGVAGDRKEWSYRIVGEGHAGDTQVDHTVDDRIFVAPSLSYQPYANTSLTLLGQYQHDKTDGQNFLPYEGTVIAAPFGRIPTNLFTSEPSIDTFTRDQAMVGYRFETTVNPNITIRQNVRYDYLTVDYQTLYGVGYATPPTVTDAELERFNFVTHPFANEFEADNQAEFRFNTGPVQHTVLTGLDYKYYNLHDDQGFAFGSNLDLLNPVYTQQTVPTSRYDSNTDVQEDVGLYAQEQFKIDRVSIVGALREDLVDTSVTNRVTGEGTDTRPTATTGKIGAIYNFDSGFAPYISYSTSFNPILGTNSASGLPYVPETAEQEEVGLKYQSPTLPITGGLALFNLTRDNVLTTDPNNALNSVQTGEQRSRGVELSASTSLPSGLKATAAFTAYQLQITKDLDPMLIGKVPTGTPEVMASLWLDYTIPEGQFRGFGVGAGVRYVGASYADEYNTLPVPAVVLGDAALHYERDHWRVALNVSNIADTVYVGSCSSATACFYGDRRKATFSVAYSW